MSVVYRFFQPTVYKLLFTVEWLAFLLLRAVERQAIDLDLLPVALWPLLLFYGLGCALVAWSRRTDRVAGGLGLAFLAVAMVGLDQVSKALATAFLPPDTSLPLIEGWLHAANVHNASGSWLGPAWLKPVLAVAATLVLPLSMIVYRYYVSTKRQSLWVDLTFVGVFAGYASWLIDIYVRGYIVDVIHIPGLVAADFKDLFLSLGICVVVEVLDNPGISRRWGGWRAEIESTRRLVADLAAFAAGELRTCWMAILKSVRSPKENG
ncbi:MAG: signal peptidase II [Anaerolineae bacterium]|nr:signal peptidase II [Anaerolineae bacterium]